MSLIKSAHDFIEINSASCHTALIGNISIGWNKVVPAINLHAMATVVKECDRACALKAGFKFFQRIEHFLATAIFGSW